MGKQAGASPNYAAPGSNPTSQQDALKQFGPPPSDVVGLQEWASKIKQAYPGGAGMISPYQQAAEGQQAGGMFGLQGPVGSSGWSQDPTTGRWTQSQQFNGPLAGAAEGLQNQIAGQGALDLSGLTGIDQGQGAQHDAENAAYQSATSRLDPQFGQQEQAMKSQLAAQGLDPGTEAYNNAYGNFSRAKNDAYSQAQQYAVGQGLQAQQQGFGQSMGARQQQLAELLQQRGMPYQNLQQLMGMLGGAQGVGSAQGPNLLGAVSAQGDFNLGQANQNNQWWGSAGQGAGAAAGGLAALLSDERAKQKIEKLPVEIHDGIPVAIFEYRHAPGLKRLGVIAQDVLKIFPRLVKKRADGLLCVDYAGLGRAIG